MLTLICLSGGFAHTGEIMNGEGEGTNWSVGKVVLVGFALIAALFLMKGLFKDSGNGGGLLSTNDCPTSLTYHIPKEQLKGVGATMTVVRCSGTLDDSGSKRPYVEISVVVNGKTNDASSVRGVQVLESLTKKTGADSRWERVPPRDKKDPGPTLKNAEVGYEKHVRWYIRHVPTRVTATIAMKTDMGSPKRVSHVFRLP
jgi:hypothetical protein